MYPFDAKVKMQLCHAIVGGMPVYESTGIEITNGELRHLFTQFLVEITDGIFLGCYSIGEPFRISYLKLLSAICELVSPNADNHAMRILGRYFPKMPPAKLATWLDWLTDQHESEHEIQFCWMTA